MAGSYHTLDAQASASEEKLSSFLRKNRQQLLPLVDLITQSRVAINELIDCVGRAMLETLLEVSAQQVAGVRQPTRARSGERHDRPSACPRMGRRVGRCDSGYPLVWV